MLLTQQLLTFWVFIFFVNGQLNAQEPIMQVDSTKTEFLVGDSSRFDKIDSVTETISEQLKILQEKNRIN